jgi:hypothetical protein
MPVSNEDKNKLSIMKAIIATASIPGKVGSKFIATTKKMAKPKDPVLVSMGKHFCRDFKAHEINSFGVESLYRAIDSIFIDYFMTYEPTGEAQEETVIRAAAQVFPIIFDALHEIFDSLDESKEPQPNVISKMLRAYDANNTITVNLGGVEQSHTVKKMWEYKDWEDLESIAAATIDHAAKKIKKI